MKSIPVLAAFVILSCGAGVALAKLPAPSDEAKAKAAEAGAKSAQAGKVAGYQLCKVQDKVAADYLARAKKEGMATKVPVATAACADPGAAAPMAAAPAAAPVKK